MRTPKGMIRVFLTNDELDQLIGIFTSRIDDINNALDNQSENVKIALRSVRDQIAERKTQLEAMRTPAPKRIGRPRGSKNHEPANCMTKTPHQFMPSGSDQQAEA